jgi:hypothetical protein
MHAFGEVYTCRKILGSSNMPVLRIVVFLAIITCASTPLRAESACEKQCKRENWTNYMQWREDCGDDADCKERAWDSKLSEDQSCRGPRCSEGPAFGPADSPACPDRNIFIFDRNLGACKRRPQPCDYLDGKCPDSPPQTHPGRP